MTEYPETVAPALQHEPSSAMGHDQGVTAPQIFENDITAPSVPTHDQELPIPELQEQAYTAPKNTFEAVPLSDGTDPSITYDVEKPSLPSSAATRNVVFFGETGVGKSAIINLLRDGGSPHPEDFGQGVATVSNAALGCTLTNTKYLCQLYDEVFALWDTAGLVEGDFGNVTAGQAEENLINLLRDMEGGGVSLLVYCIRARRFRNIVKSHYELFFEKTCGKQVPMVLVVTGLENETPTMEDWWVRNEGEFTKRGLEFAGHACITATRGKFVPGEGYVFDAEYKESFQLLRSAIANGCAPTNVSIRAQIPWYSWKSTKQKLKATKKTFERRFTEDGDSGTQRVSDDTGTTVFGTLTPLRPSGSQLVPRTFDVYIGHHLFYP